MIVINYDTANSRKSYYASDDANCKVLCEECVRFSNHVLRAEFEITLGNQTLAFVLKDTDTNETFNALLNTINNARNVIMSAFGAFNNHEKIMYGYIDDNFMISASVDDIGKSKILSIGNVYSLADNSFDTFTLNTTDTMVFSVFLKALETAFLKAEEFFSRRFIAG